jgi:L-asparagine transporter-like permease
VFKNRKIKGFGRMKDIVRMFAYTAGSIAVILLLIGIVTGDGFSDGMGIFLAVLLVVVLPVVLSIYLVGREKQKEAAGQD